jgi:hypothetical protein
MTVTRSDFSFGKWVLDERGEEFFSNGENRYIKDEVSSKYYLNESKGVIRFKCFLLALGTPIVHAIATIANMVFLGGRPSRENAIKFVAQPFAFVGLELAAIFGVIFPYDGRKLYASIERFQYGGPILAPCFQPEADEHLFNGDIDEQNAY